MNMRMRIHYIWHVDTQVAYNYLLVHINIAKKPCKVYFGIQLIFFIKSRKKEEVEKQKSLIIISYGLFSIARNGVTSKLVLALPGPPNRSKFSFGGSPIARI